MATGGSATTGTPYSRRRFLAAAGGAVGVVSLAACAPTATAPSAQPAVAGFLSPGVGAPKRGGILTGGTNTGEPLHHDASAGGGNSAVVFCFEELLRWRGNTFDDQTLEPHLAESWSVSPDGLTYTFNIRKGVKWQNLPPVNGRLFDANDVAWNLQFYSEKSPTRKQIMSVIDGWKVKDQYTIDITLKHPFAPFLGTVIMRGFYMLAKEVFDKAGHFRETPIGTGPYMFERWDRGTSMRWKANPDYWRMGADGKPLPYTNGFTTFFFKDEAAVVASLMADQLLMFPAPDPVTLTLPKRAELKKGRPDFLFQDALRANVHMVLFNQRIKPWDQARARQAIGFAMDKDEIIAAGVDGDSERSGLIPSNLAPWGWPINKVKEKYPFNKAQAQQVVKDLGLTGRTIELMTNAPNETTQALQVFAAQLEAIGLKSNLTLPISVAAGQAQLLAGKFEIAYFIAGTSYEPDDWLTRYWATTGQSNFSGYSNPRFDALADAQRKEVDPTKRRSLIEQAQDILHADTAGVGVCLKSTSHIVVNPKVKNVRSFHFTYADFASMWID